MSGSYRRPRARPGPITAASPRQLRTTSRPSTRAWPASGSRIVARIRTAVVLPPLFGPCKPRTLAGLDRHVDAIRRDDRVGPLDQPMCCDCWVSYGRAGSAAARAGCALLPDRVTARARKTSGISSGPRTLLQGAVALGGRALLRACRGGGCAAGAGGVEPGRGTTARAGRVIGAGRAGNSALAMTELWPVPLRAPILRRSSAERQRRVPAARARRRACGPG
jgi:hypothetical protein